MAPREAKIGGSSERKAHGPIVNNYLEHEIENLQILSCWEEARYFIFGDWTEWILGELGSLF